MARGGLAGGADPCKPSVQWKENSETAAPGPCQHVAGLVAWSVVLVHVLVGCFLWLWLNALAVVFVAVGLC